MTIPPIATQLLVAGTTHLAALSAGGVVAYPSVLLQQLRSNDTEIQLDLDRGSWIGSVHGIAGIPSILLPCIMQYRGRKFAFILSCLSLITGWAVTYFAQNIIMLIIGECFHGLGTNSLIAVSFLSVSEMVEPKYRNVCLIVYGTVHSLGISSVGIIGAYLHWKTVGLIMCSPVLLALPLSCIWPESPSWLACKGRYSECEKAFTRLRGTDENSKKELKAMVNSQKNILMRSASSLKNLGKSFRSRDFYLPTLHTFILINTLYWGGGIPVIIYASDMLLRISGEKQNIAKVTMDVLFFVGFNIAAVLVKYFGSKRVMLSSMAGSAFFMTAAAIVGYLQSFGVVPLEMNLGVYCMIAYMASLSLGSTCLGFSISSEIMPVKYRGMGGSLYVVFACVLHYSCLKAYPYLCLYINVWGIFLVYGLYEGLSVFVIWKYIPETRNRTLQEIEDYYVNGYFKKVEDDNVDTPFIKLDNKI